MSTQHEKGTIHHAIDEFLATKRRRSPATVIWYRQQLTTWLAWLDDNHVTGLDWLEPSLLDQFLADETDRGLAPSTIHARFRALRALFRWLKKRNKLAQYQPPTEVIEAPPCKTAAPRQADPDAVQRVLDAIPSDTWLDDRDRLLIELLRSTGLRVEEAISLCIQDVDLEDGFVYVQAGKGDKPRLAPFGDAVRNAFITYMENRPRTTGSALFLAASGHRRPLGRLKTTGVRQLLHRRCAAAGEAYINPHSLRHLFAIKALNDGISLSAVAAILGHTSPAFTARVYARWVKRSLRREYDAHWQQ